MMWLFQETTLSWVKLEVSIELSSVFVEEVVSGCDCEIGRN